MKFYLIHTYLSYEGFSANWILALSILVLNVFKMLKIPHTINMTPVMKQYTEVLFTFIVI